MPRIVVSLLLGVAVTVTVAWWLANMNALAVVRFVGPRTGVTSRSQAVWTAPDSTIWAVRIERGRGAVRVTARVAETGADLDSWIAAVAPGELRDQGLPGWSHLFRRPSTPATLRTTIVEHARGWPLPALHYREITPPFGPTGLSGGLRPGDWWADAGGDLVLPVRPCWAGLFVDTALYGAAVWVLLTVPLVLLHGLRRAAGRCAGCGYDLEHGTHERCPECGAAAR